MKSYIFSIFDIEKTSNEDFYLDVNHFFDLRPNDAMACVENIPNILSAYSSKESNDIAFRISKEISVDIKTVGGALRFLLFLHKTLSTDVNSKDDTCDAILDDIIELGFVDKDSGELYEPVFSRLIEHARDSGNTFYARKMASQGVMSTFTGIGSTVEARAIILNQFRHGDQPEDYQPNIVELTAIATIAITTDQDKMPFVCQFTYDDLVVFINKLKSVEKDLLKLKEKVGA